MLRLVSLIVLTVVLVASPSLAQESKPSEKEKAPKKTVSGEVSAVGKDSLSITSGGKTWTFVVGKKTRVLANGEKAKKDNQSKEAKAQSETRPITELVKAKQSVEVTYRERKGALHAGMVKIRS